MVPLFCIKFENFPPILIEYCLDQGKDLGASFVCDSQGFLGRVSIKACLMLSDFHSTIYFLILKIAKVCVS